MSISNIEDEKGLLEIVQIGAIETIRAANPAG